MAISRERKEELVAEYVDQFARSKGVLMAHYSALTVAQMQKLRRKVREQHGEVFVVKNTLFTHMLKEQGITPPEDMIKGTLLVAFCHQDVPPMAKLFRDFTKEADESRFSMWGAIMDRHFYGAKEAVSLSDMPSREVLLAQVLGTINAPATQTVGVVAGGIRQVLNVLQAYADKLGGTNEVAAEAAA